MYNLIVAVNKYKCNTINNMISDGVSRFIELGPKNILSNMSKKLHENTSFDSYEELIENESI